MADAGGQQGGSRTRRAVLDLLEGSIRHGLRSTVLHLSLILLILANVAVCAAWSMPDLRSSYGMWFQLIDSVSVAVFAIEYGLRIWSCVELPFFAAGPAWQGRLRFASQPMQIIDLMAFLPALIAWGVGADAWPLMMLRFLKIARYTPALVSLGRVLAAERSALFGAFMIMLTLLLFSATGMYFIERDLQPIAFGSIPAAAWWSVVTLATVGYGDVVPISGLGRAFGGVIIILGIATFALPVGIIATGFSRESTRRDFMVSWSLVARVPLFAGLDATAVSQIITLLYSRTFESGDVLVRRGMPGDNMFFIVSGEVVVEREAGDILLKEGDFLGEMALLEQRPRSHTVRALGRVRALVLDREDLDRLGRQHPKVLQSIHDVAAVRRTAPQSPA